jgi:hypothetical protein
MSKQAKQSHYQEKLKAGKQLYGPGCCANKLSDAEVNRAKSNAQAREHFRCFTHGRDFCRVC